MENKSVQTASPPAAEKKRKGFIDAFLEGGQRGVKMWALSMLPGAIFGFTVIEVLKTTGLLAVFSTVFAPLMGLFGLPGEAFTAWITSFLALPGGCAAALSLIADGTLTGRQVAILLPMMFLVSNQIQYVGRVLAVSKVPGHKYVVVSAISVICSMTAGLIMNFIV